MTTVQPTPPPPWAQAIDRNRKVVAQALLGLSGLLLVVVLYVWWKYGGDQAPLIAGTFLMALAAVGGGLWFLNEPTGEVRGTDAARLLVLIEGGVLGLALTIFTFWQMIHWWSDISGGAEAWRGANRWHLWVLAGTGFVGLAVMLFSLLLARGEENASRTLRVLLYGYNAVLTGILLFVVLIVANLLAYAVLPETADWTASGIYTLDRKSENVLKGLSQPVTIYVIEENRNTLLSRELHELMDNVRSVNSRVQVEYLLRDQNIEPVADLMQKYKLADDVGVLILYGSKDNELHQFLRQTELVQTTPPDFMNPNAPRPAPKFRGEDAIISAIEFMEMDQKKPTAYFVQGNGCLDLFGLDRDATPDRTGKALADRLREDHYEVKGWVLSDTTLPETPPLVTVGLTVPDDASVVVIARPQEAFNDKQIEALRHFMSTRYRLTESTIGLLRVAGVPEAVLEKLKGVTDKEYGAPEFSAELGKAVESISDNDERTRQEALILKHARRQGKLMVMLDVVPDKSDKKKWASLGLQGLLSEYNVDIPGERVLRFDPSGRPPPEVVVVTTNAELRGKNPLATAFEGKPLVMRDVRVVRPKQSGEMPNPAASQHQADVLLHTAHPFEQLNPPSAVLADSDLGDATDLIRSHLAELQRKRVAVLPVGVAVSDAADPHAGLMRGRMGGTESVPRMVVLGSAGFASDAAITSPRGRAAEREKEGGALGYDLFSSALAWLNEKPASIGVTKKDRGVYKMDANADLSSMRLTPFLLMSVAIIGLGLGVWVVRRR